MARLWTELLAQDGWVFLRSIGYTDFLAMLQTLGQLNSPQLLKPQLESSRGDSLSGKHGLRAFPFHTDGAAQPSPPPYIRMWSAKPSTTATLLVDGASPQLAVSAFENAWLVSPGAAARPFYAIPRLRKQGRVEWRLNPDCMRPARAGSPVVDFDGIFAAIEQIRIAWRACDGLILNNMRMLHSRETVNQGDLDREILRIQVRNDMVR